MSVRWMNFLIGLGLMLGGLDPVFGATAKDFIGDYRLEDTVSGYCFPETRVSAPVFQSDIFDISVGEYFFPRVNGGEWTYDDQFERGRSISYITDDYKLIHRTDFFDKLRKEPGSRDYLVTVSRNGVLRLRAEYSGAMSGFVNECVYRRFNPDSEQP